MFKFKRLIVLVAICLPMLAWAGENAEFSDLDFNSIGDEHTTMVRNVYVRPRYEQTSPWQAIPGSYSSKNGSYYANNQNYKAKDIYSAYLTTGAYEHYSKNCANFYGQAPKLGKLDLDNAFDYATAKVQKAYPEYGKGNVNKKQVEAELMEYASQYLAKNKCLSKYQLSSYLPSMSIGQQYKSSRYGDASCTPFYNEKYACQKAYGSKYRTLDGSCNNPYHPYWGRSNTCHIRLLPGDYSDGVHNFRMSHDGRPLPLPRIVSNKVALAKDFKTFYTSMVLAIGQFVNHDISNTDVYSNANNLDCCQKPDYRCVAMHMIGEDYMTKKYQQYGCHNFIRSASCPLCKLGATEQLNSQTSFIDLSLVYGPNDQVSAKLRSHKNGMLAQVMNKKHKPILPPDASIKPCSPLHKGAKCFAAGDNRANQHPLLLSLHNVFLRNHNKHAAQLKRVNPHWDDNRLFQEARRLLIAEYQHITYNEYLPVIMGPILSEYYSLRSKYSGHTYYEPYTDPSSWNEFSAAASRYGHSQIKDYYKVLGYGAGYNKSSHILLRDNFFEPGIVWDDLVDDILRGMIDDPANTVDPYYSVTAKNYILRQKGQRHGMDLVAVNILRGRDHGLPGYTHYLKACFNFEAKSWKDLEKFIPVEVLFKLQKLYGSIADIDLYIGGVSEKHFANAAIGPTFSCLVGIQYYHAKFGDRYFYEHGGQSGSFTPAQLDNIRQTSSLARLLCRGSGIQVAQPKVLYLPSKYNAPVPCASYPDINYQLWKGA